MSDSSHSTLTVALALGLGAALMSAVSPSPAVGYPVAAVSTGSNPVVAAGGTVSPGSTSTILGVHDERLIITDVVITLFGDDGSNDCNIPVSIDSGGAELAKFYLASDTQPYGTYLQPTNISHSYESGLPVESGDNVGVTNHGSHCTVAYSVSGYLAQP